MAREQDLSRLYTETLAIPAGSTASFVTMPGFYGFALQFISGGTLFLGGPSFSLGASYINGSSFQLGGFGSTAGVVFPLVNTNLLMINDFVGSFNLIAGGATVVCSMIRVFAQNI